MSISSNNSSVALSMMQTLTSSDTVSSMISVINGGATLSGGDPVAALIQAEKTQTKSVQLQQKDPTTKAEVNRFLSVVSKAKTLQDVLKDPIAQKVLLTANGLSSKIGYTALMQKALMSDPSQSDNFASTLDNAAMTSMVSTFDFAKNGLSVLKQSASAVATEYATAVWQQNQDEATPGLSAALDFRSRASTMTTVDQILGDTNIRAVVTGALGIPQQIAFQPLEAQEKAITSRLDIKKLQDPKFVENLARQYLINNQNASSTTSSLSLLS